MNSLFSCDHMHEVGRGTDSGKEWNYASGCPCIAAASRRRQQQHASASQPMADNYALATVKRTT